MTAKVINLIFEDEKGIGLKFELNEFGNLYTALATPEFIADFEDFIKVNTIKKITVTTQDEV